ncbi:hypothetical protein BZA05DRAFT_17210 [Tricharina praecox]|uniref:uncharacterized protein n=1 Tax=Tricharina praecox TaxID=43433 RepID=UPI00221EBBA5|nr:uncharacterized protein BZA05DRAFT_17210 [Tricharina praecox]KAI5858918.1 hypothetical protein BZA05DRAFT_17210 [Tricharina praecox]
MVDEDAAWWGMGRPGQEAQHPPVTHLRHVFGRGGISLFPFFLRVVSLSLFLFASTLLSDLIFHSFFPFLFSFAFTPLTQRVFSKTASYPFPLLLQLLYSTPG